MLDVTEQAAVHMLARCFQRYHAVSDSALSGIMTSDAATSESPAPILRHALKLAGECETANDSSVLDFAVLVLDNR